MTGFDAYITYLALKQHFTNDTYDFFKYNGRVRANKESFDVRRDRFFFVKLANKFKMKPNELTDYLVANLLHDPTAWIGSMVGIQADKIYQEWKRSQQSLMYQMETEISKIADEMEVPLTEKQFESLFVCLDGQHPELLSLYSQDEISIETLIGFDLVFGCFKKWNAQIHDTVIWPDIYKLCQNYKPFLSVNKEKCRDVMVKNFM